MPHYVGLDVSQKTTAICVVDEQGRRLWRGACVTDPGAISARVLRHAGVVDVKVGIETGSMTPWLVHGLRSAGLDVECLDARRVKAALQMRLNRTDETTPRGWRLKSGQSARSFYSGALRPASTWTCWSQSSESGSSSRASSWVMATWLGEECCSSAPPRVSSSRTSRSLIRPDSEPGRQERRAPGSTRALKRIPNGLPANLSKARWSPTRT